MADRVRVGIVGMGIGRSNGLALDNNPRGEVTALCDLSEGRMRAFQDQLGREVTLYTDYRGLCADDAIDAIFIGTPNQNHVPIAIRAVEEGKHVLVTKPLADSVGAAGEVVQAAEEEGVVNMMSLTSRFSPSCVYLQGLADEGRFGDLYYAKASSIRRDGIPLGYCDRHPEETDPDLGFIRKGGGAMRDMGVHVLDSAWALLGKPRPVRAVGVAGARFGPRGLKYSGPADEGVARRFETDDYAGGFVRCEGGVGIQVESFWASHHPTEFQVEIFGTEAGATLRPLVIYRTESGGLQDVEVDPADDLGGVERVAEIFISCILDGRENPAPLRDGLVVQKMLEAVLQSGEGGREVEIE